MKKEGLKEISFEFEGQRIRIERSKPKNPSLSVWARFFQMLAIPNQKGQKNLAMGLFMKQNYPELRLADLEKLVQPLRNAQAYRNHATHPDPFRAYDQEREEPQQIRALVLGVECPSIIVQTFQLLAPDRPPKQSSEQ